MLKVLYKQFIFWFGFVCCALAITSNLSSLITFADSVHWVVSHFTQLLHLAWSWLGSIFGISISREAASLLSFCLFYTSITVSSLRRSSRFKRNIDRTKLLYALTFTFLGAIGYMYRWYIDAVEPEGRSTIVLYAILLPAYLLPPIILGYGNITQKILLSLLWTLLMQATELTLIRGYFTSFDPPLEIFRTVAFLFALTFPMMFVSAYALNKRISFLLIGVAIIFGLSEFSKLVPKLSTAIQSLPPS